MHTLNQVYYIRSSEIKQVPSQEINRLGKKYFEVQEQKVYTYVVISLDRSILKGGFA